MRAWNTPRRWPLTKSFLPKREAPVDENLSPLHARAIRELGHDAVSIAELGLSGADDSTVRSAAIKGGRIFVTLDADFANVFSLPLKFARRDTPQDTPGHRGSHQCATPFDDSSIDRNELGREASCGGPEENPDARLILLD